MTEGLLRHRDGDRLEVESAGTRSGKITTEAIVKSFWLATAAKMVRKTCARPFIGVPIRGRVLEKTAYQPNVPLSRTNSAKEYFEYDHRFLGHHFRESSTAYSLGGVPAIGRSNDSLQPTVSKPSFQIRRTGRRNARCSLNFFEGAKLMTLSDLSKKIIP
jgi:hypothetical protein